MRWLEILKWSVETYKMKSALIILASILTLSGCSTQSRQAWGYGFAAGLQSMGQAANSQPQPAYQPQQFQPLPPPVQLESWEDKNRRLQQDQLIREQTDYYRRQNMLGR